MRRNPGFTARAWEAFTSGPTSGPRFTAAKGEAPAELLIYDVIGGGYWDDGVTAKAVLAALASAGTGPVRVRINSPGGDVFEGMAIRNALLQHPGEVECVVDGLAASAASYIALSGKKLAMHASSMFMIHNARTITLGTRADMAATAEVLGKIDGQLVAIYAGKTGRDPAEIAAAMDAETWYTATEAQAAGFADSVIPAKSGDEAKAQAPTAPRAEADPAPARSDPSAPTSDPVPPEAARTRALARLRLAESEQH